MIYHPFSITSVLSCCRGARINRRDKDNYTPLLLAATYGHVQTVELLLQKGADYTAVDKYDKTAIYLAAEENKLAVLEVRRTQALNSSYVVAFSSLARICKNVRPFIPRSTLVPLFIPQSVHSGPASREACGWLFPNKWHVSLFRDSFPH